MSIIIKSGASGNLMTIDSTGAARSSLYDTSGTAITNVTLGSSLYQGCSTVQTAFTSTNNSSTSNLASAASFTGTADSLAGYGAICVIFFADQQCTVQVQQSSNGTNWDIADSYVVIASTGDARNFQAVATNVRVVVTNNGGGTTTALRLQTVLRPVEEVMARALTQLGNSKVGLVETTIAKPTYTAVAAAFTPPATPTDMVTLTGSATRTIRITRIEFTSTQTTAGVNTIFLVKRSTANSAGTSTALTAVSHDSSNSAATATALSYTANPTLGTTVGNIRATRVLSDAITSVSPDVQLWEFNTLTSQSIVLRGTSQVLAINFNGAALPAGLSVTAAIEWTEEL